MTNTKLDGEAVKASAANLGRIMDDMSAFTSLRAAWPALGDFDLARQLQAIVDDRRTGVGVHADQLKSSLEEMSKALHKVATDVENVDNGTASNLLAVVADLRTRVREDIALLDQPAH